MAEDKKTSLLPAAGTLTGNELIPGVQSGSDVKITVQEIANLAAGGGGNTNITNITASALNTLRLASNISTTTFYNVTNAVGNTLVLQVYCFASNTNTPYAINIATGDIGYYNITDDEFFSVLPVVPSGIATVIDIDKASFIGLFPGFEVDPKACYRITDATQGVVRVYGVTTGTSTAAAFLEGSWDGSVLTDGAWGNYNVGTDTFTAIVVVWGSITGNILDQTDVGARRDVNGNVFLGDGNTGNTLVASNNNVFNQSADANDLTNSTGNYFSVGAWLNILDGSGNNYFGINSTSNNLTDSPYNHFEDNTSNLKLNTSTQNIFGNGVTNLNTINADFSNCKVAENLNFASIDFANATQLFGRANRWSINKVLGTNLIEVTFNRNLLTAQTGQYDTSTDTFTPNPTIVSFTKTLTATQIKAGGYFDIDEMPSVSGAYWQFCECFAVLAGQTKPYDGVAPTLSLWIDGAGDAQTSDPNDILASGNFDGSTYLTIEQTFNTLKVGKGQVNIKTSSPNGDGTLTVYGTAQLVTI